MNILLQSKKTLNYITDLPAWTQEREKARHFDTGIEALFFCFNRHLEDMQILGGFFNQQIDFTIPVTDLRAADFQAKMINDSPLNPSGAVQCKK